MTVLSRVRAEIARELAEVRSESKDAIPDDFDRLLQAVAAASLPSESVIEALIADASPTELPAGFEERAALRRRALIGERQRSAPRLGQLLREAGRAKGETSRTIAQALGIAPSVWQSIEDDEAPAALLNLPPTSVSRLIERLGLSRPQVALALRTALAQAPGAGFGYRPQQAPEEAGPAIVEPADQTERIWQWLLAFTEA
jgi:AraC-like DNA-binding protein